MSLGRSSRIQFRQLTQRELLMNEEMELGIDEEIHMSTERIRLWRVSRRLGRSRFLRRGQVF